MSSPAGAQVAISTEGDPNNADLRHCVLTYPSPWTGVMDLGIKGLNAFGFGASKPSFVVEDVEYTSHFGWMPSISDGCEKPKPKKKAVKRFQLFMD